MKKSSIPRPFFPGFMLIPFLIRLAFPAAFSGVVVDKENGDKPIPGVLVSGGHSLSRTFTDEQGRFSLADAPFTVGALPSPEPCRSQLHISWNSRKGIIDVSRAPGLRSVSIYSLKGSRLFHKDIAHNDRQIRFPALSRGIFIMKITTLNNAAFSRKWTALGANGGFVIPAEARGALHKSDSETGYWGILFRHDAYFPVDRKFASPEGSLVIGMKPDPAGAVFDWGKIHSYSFTVSREDSLSMEKNAGREHYVPADFSFDGVSFGKAGLRFKGSQYYLLPACFDSTSGRVGSDPRCAKVSMKIKFDKYDDTARFHSLKRLNMHAMADDPSKLREMLCYGLFRDMGIYAPRTAFIKLFVNNSFWGLFVAVEEPDGRFTKSRWPAYGDGNLYKEVWPNSERRGYYEDNLATNNNPEDSAKAWQMVKLFIALQNSTKETFVQKVSPFMDLDYFLRYIAVDRAIHNADGIMTWYCDTASGWKGNHNFYFYEEENPGGKLWLIPWDLPATLTKTDPIIDDYDVPEWNVTPASCKAMPIWGGSFGVPPNCDKLTKLTAAALWDNFKAVGGQLLSTFFKSGRLKRNLDTLAVIAEPVVAQDPALDVKRWRGDVKDLRATLTVLDTGFDDYIHGRTGIVDTAGFAAPFCDSAFLRIDCLNNFELPAAAGPRSWVSGWATKGSTYSPSLDTLAPLWGKSDLLFSFALCALDTPTAHYSEGAMMNLPFRNTTDCTGLKRIRMHLKCDVSRYCFISLMSDVYEQKGAKSAYGWSFPVSAKSKEYTLDMATIGYSSSRENEDPGILDTVLLSMKGIGVWGAGRFNDLGKLMVSPDSGYVRVDNVIFEK